MEYNIKDFVDLVTTLQTEINNIDGLSWVPYVSFTYVGDGSITFDYVGVTVFNSEDYEDEEITFEEIESIIRAEIADFIESNSKIKIAAPGRLQVPEYEEPVEEGWTRFYFEGNLYFGFINSKADWEKVKTAYKESGDEDTLLKARNLGVDSPPAQFGSYKEYNGNKTLGEFAKEHNLDLS
jgi:hypothetical protein